MSKVPGFDRLRLIGTSGLGLLRKLWPFLFRGKPCKKQSHPLRWNLILIAVLIALLNYGNIAFTCVAIRQATAGQFVIGALTGLLPAGITGLIELGNTMLNKMSR